MLLLTGKEVLTLLQAPFDLERQHPTTPLTGCEPNFCIDVSSEHTPIHSPSRKNRFNLESDLTNTVAASEDLDHLPQRLAASGSQHSVASTVPTLLNLGSLSSDRKLVRGTDSVASVEESVVKRKRDRD